jgi:hypothetical protein
MSKRQVALMVKLIEAFELIFHPIFERHGVNGVATLAGLLTDGFNAQLYNDGNPIHPSLAKHINDRLKAIELAVLNTGGLLQ